MNEFATKYEEKGYERVNGQVIDEQQPIDSARVYTAQVVILREDVAADIIGRDSRNGHGRHRFSGTAAGDQARRNSDGRYTS